MSQQELLIKVVDVLETSGIQYMLTGSYASSIQGEPRATHDIDLVVVIPPKSIKTFVAAFPSPEYYLDEDAVKDARKVQEQESSTSSILNLYLIPVLELKPPSEGKPRRKNYRQHVGFKFWLSAYPPQ